MSKAHSEVMKYIASATGLLNLNPSRSSDWELIAEDLEKAAAVAQERADKLWHVENEED